MRMWVLPGGEQHPLLPLFSSPRIALDAMGSDGRPVPEIARLAGGVCIEIRHAPETVFMDDSTA